MTATYLDLDLGHEDETDEDMINVSDSGGQSDISIVRHERLILTLEKCLILVLQIKIEMKMKMRFDTEQQSQDTDHFVYYLQNYIRHHLFYS